MSSKEILKALAGLPKTAEEEETVSEPVKAETETETEAIEIPAEDPQPVEDAPASTSEQETSDDGESDTPKGQMSDFLTDAVKKMLDQQVGNELFAFYEYSAAKAWFHGIGLDGFAAWCGKQAGDEITHMNKVLDFLTVAGVVADLPGLQPPPTSYSGATAVVEAILEREKAVTANWRAIGDQAMEDGDSATLQLAQCFLIEQMEEEDGVKSIHSRLLAAGGDGPGLLILDHQLETKYAG